MWPFGRDKPSVPEPEDCLPGRATPMPLDVPHLVSKMPLRGPYPVGLQQAVFGLGCFWGAERLFWQMDGVYVTAAGYAGGTTPNPTYDEVCSGATGHAEVVLVVFDPAVTSYEALLAIFWQSHNPTQGMRQGNDTGTQYRSAIYTTTPEQQDAAYLSKAHYQEALLRVGYGAVTTEIRELSGFYFAEAYHQQYLAQNPGGYCGLQGTGVSCPIGFAQG